MKEIGAILKAAREEKGLSLDEIQMATKIRYKHLEAMEAGEFDQLPGEVYVKGFLGNYAKMVGLEAEEILRKYLALKNQPSPTEQEGQALDQEKIWPATVTPQKVPQQRSIPQKKTLGLALAGIGLLVMITMIIWAFQGWPSTVSPAEPVAEAGAGLAPEQSAPTEPVAPETGAQTAPDLTAEETPAAEEGRDWVAPQPVLAVEADEVVWMGLYRRVSGALIFEGTLYPGERREWTLTEEVILRIGNAGGLSVTYRGEELGKLGSSGQVINKVITVE